MCAIETSTPIPRMRYNAGVSGLARAGRDPAPVRDVGMRPSQQLRIPDLILICLIAVQLASLAAALEPLVARVADHQGASAKDGGARIAFGDQFGDFLQYVDGFVPPDGRVVVPPIDVDSTYGDVGLMQYLLFPREIVNCPAGADLPGCVQSLIGQRTYILRVGDFPAPEDVPASKVYSSFAATLGLYRRVSHVDGRLAGDPRVPARARRDLPSDGEGIHHLLTPWMELAAAAALSLALGALGVAILRLLLVRIQLLDVLALGFPLGAGIFTWFLFIASWAGVPLSIASGSLSWVVLLVMALVIREVIPVRQDAMREKHASRGLLPGALGWGPPVALLFILGAAGFAAWLGIRACVFGLG